jgi:Peptidase family M1 domain
MIRPRPMVWLLLCLISARVLARADGPRSNSASQPTTAEDLYAQLRGVGLDKSRVYRVREASIDRAGTQIMLDSGTIAFTSDILGRITGAFFEGDGEVLLSPPNHAERASMALFTGMAILEEQFSTAYFRFNDDLFAELQPSLRRADNADQFVSQWNGTAQRLAELDALRLLLTFSRFLPQAGQITAAVTDVQSPSANDRLLHARVQGRKLGTFDLLFDGMATESVWAGQTRTTESGTYYDLWTSFPAKQPAARSAEAEMARDSVHISGYVIRTDVHPPTELDADARLQVDVLRGGQRTLLFELSRFLNIKTIRANGKPLEFIHNQALEGTQLQKRGNDLVAVVFPSTLKTGDHLQLHFVYGGDVLSDAGKGLLYVGARGTWYPNRGISMSNFDLEFHYPAGWNLLATGKRVAIEGTSLSSNNVLSSEPTGEQVGHWVSERPIPVAGFNLGKYARAVAHAGAVTVESYATAVVERGFPRATTEVLPIPDARHPLSPTAPPIAMTVPPPSPARNAQPVADQSARAIDFFARCFGPFPYSSLELTQMPGEMSQGWPGLVFLSSYAFLTAAERKDLHIDRVNSILDAQVLVHETAHQWWGDLIGWESYRDQWTMEALANYSAMMMLQSQNQAAFRDVMTKFREDLEQKNSEGQMLKDAGPVTLGSRLSSSHFANGYEAISYGRGTWLFHMLREMLRDAQARGQSHSARTTQEEEPFIRTLRKLRERYEGKVISTRELLDVFAEDLPPSLRYEGRKSLDWFLDGWVNGTAIPRYDLQGVKYIQKETATLVTGTLLQRDAPDDLVTSVPIYAALPGRAPVLLGRVFADGPETTFRLPAAARTRKILVDPYQTVLSRVR